MSEFICPKGHHSSESDYCSECGAKMDEVPAMAATPSSGGTEVCPDCGTPRDQANIAFCEICGYNFVTGAHGDLSAVAPVVDPPKPAGEWVATLSVDPALREDGSPEAPADTGPFAFALSAPASLIGRRSQARAVFPEIPVTYDDAVSHRHALLQLGEDGGLTLRDIGSSNGTKLNGAELAAMVDVPLKEGDVVTLGHWSKIVVGRG